MMMGKDENTIEIEFIDYLCDDANPCNGFSCLL